MSEPESTSQGQSASAEGGKLYTLSEVSNRTGISMPTLQRYKKLYQNRIPSVGKGRKQRYPESALPVFDELKSENAGKRGRPRKDAAKSSTSSGSTAGRRGRAAAGARKSATPQRATAPNAGRAGRKGGAAKRGTAAAAAPAPAAKRGRKPGRKPGRPAGSGAAKRTAGGAKKSGNLLTLTQVSEQTGISYPTLVRYVRVHSDRLPSEGAGRSRRFYPEAVSVFRELRQESGRGGRKKGSTTAASKGAARGGRGRAASSGRADEGFVTQRLKALEKTQQDLEKRLRGFVSSLQKLFK